MRKRTSLLAGILALIILVFYFWSKLFLVSVALLVVFDSFSFSFLSVKIKKVISPNTFTYIKGIYIVIFPVFLILLIRTLFFDYYYVPSTSMEKTLFPGDYVIINKVKYGAKIPNHIENIPGIGGFIETSTSKNEPVDLYRQLKGYASFKREDIVVFKSVEYHDKFMVKRIIGLPNDTLQITDSKVFINNVLLVENEKYCYNYIDTLSNIKLLNTYSNREFKALEKSSYKKDIRGKNTFNINLLFSFSIEQKWTRDNYGSIIIPKKGMKIILDKNNINLYKGIIYSYENTEIKLDDNLPLTYTFQNNYYFMLGDNRHNSHDSRHYGFVPESYIQGEVVRVF